MSELEDRVDAVMNAVPEQVRFLRWCPSNGPCACLGCITQYVGGKITASMWADWKRRHDRRSGTDRRRTD